jgi:hypothetical protein
VVASRACQCASVVCAACVGNSDHDGDIIRFVSLPDSLVANSGDAEPGFGGHYTTWAIAALAASVFWESFTSNGDGIFFKPGNPNGSEGVRV